MRITLAIHGMTAGGAERVLSIMANYWAARGEDVTLVTDDNPADTDFYALDNSIERLSAYLAGAGPNPRGLGRIVAAVKRLALMRRQIIRSKPDVVISFIDEMNVRVLLSMLGTKIPVIVSERIDPAKHKMARTEFARLRPWAYKRARIVTAQTKKALMFFDAAIQAIGEIVPNPVILSDRFDGPNEEAIKNGKRILAMGRLDPQKGFDLLIDSFARIAPSFPDWTLEIWGEGEERSNLGKQIESLGLARQILLQGRTKEPILKMRESSLFVLSSRYEGFPNVLCEAMASGLPVVSFDCDSGPSDIIRDNHDGLLVPEADLDGLAAAMQKLMDAPEERLRIAKNSGEVLTRFHIDRVMGIWDSLIQQACKGASIRNAG